MAELHQELGDFATRTDAEVERIVSILRNIFDDEPGNRRRLNALRRTPEYELAFSETEPLVSIIIPTFTNYTALRDRAIPSALAQTYANIEVVVAGDCAPPETAEVIAQFNDPRIMFSNLTIRGPYPEDDDHRWLVAGVPAYNAALRKSRGRWIAPFADDDALRPDALAKMIDAVKRERYEACYGLLRYKVPDGEDFDFGEFPPQFAKFGLQGGVYHSGLQFIEQELDDWLFQASNDWAMVRRMLRAGVRFGFLDQVVCDYYPSRLRP